MIWMSGGIQYEEILHHAGMLDRYYIEEVY